MDSNNPATQPAKANNNLPFPPPNHKNRTDNNHSAANTVR